MFIKKNSNFFAEGTDEDIDGVDASFEENIIIIFNWAESWLNFLRDEYFFVRILWPQGIFSKMEILYRSSSNFHSLIWLKKEFPQCINILKFAILGYSSIAKYKKI